MIRELPPRKIPPIMATRLAPVMVTMLSIATPTMASPIRPLGLTEKLWTTMISPRQPITPAMIPAMTKGVPEIAEITSIPRTMDSAAKKIEIPEPMRASQINPPALWRN